MKPEIPIEEQERILDNKKKNFIAILEKRIVDDPEKGISLQKTIGEFITQERMSYRIDQDHVTVIFPNGEEVELSSETSTRLIKNGINKNQETQRMFVEVVMSHKVEKLQSEEEEKAINDIEKGTKLNEIVLIDYLKKIRIRIKQLQNQINQREKNKEKKRAIINDIEDERLKKEKEKEIEELERKIKELKEQILILELEITKIEKSIDAYKKKEEEIKKAKKDKPIIPPGIENKNDNEAQQEKTDKKHEEKENDKEAKKRRMRALLIALAALSLPPVIFKACSSIARGEEQNTETETEEEKKSNDQKKPPIEEDDLPQRRQASEELKQEIYKSYYKKITQNIHPGEIIREKQDAYDGYNYDQGIMGRETTEYSYNQEKTVEPGADFIKRFEDFEKKYENGSYEQLDEMLSEGISLLTEYRQIVGETIEEVHKHNESTQEAIDTGIRDTTNNRYATQKEITLRQEKDLLIEHKNIDEILESISKEHAEELISGYERGKYEIIIQEDGIIVIGDVKTGSTIISSTDQIIEKGVESMVEKSETIFEGRSR